jgi:hypothetical protein
MITHLGGNSGSAKEPAVLVHIERNAPNIIRLKQLGSQIVNEPERRDNESGGPWQLGPTIWGGVVPDRFKL